MKVLELYKAYLDSRDALVAMLTDYRTEGCPDPKCMVCKSSNAAEAKARAILALPSPSLRDIEGLQQ